MSNSVFINLTFPMALHLNVMRVLLRFRFDGSDKDVFCHSLLGSLCVSLLPYLNWRSRVLVLTLFDIYPNIILNGQTLFFFPSHSPINCDHGYQTADWSSRSNSDWIGCWCAQYCYRLPCLVRKVSKLIFLTHTHVHTCHTHLCDSEPQSQQPSLSLSVPLTHVHTILGTHLRAHRHTHTQSMVNLRHVHLRRSLHQCLI